MNQEDVISLGWEPRHPGKPDKGINTFCIKEEFGQSLLAISLTPDEDGFYICNIGWVDCKVTVNIWEHVEPEFNGIIKTKEDLHFIMRLTRVIEY